MSQTRGRVDAPRLEFDPSVLLFLVLAFRRRIFGILRFAGLIWAFLLLICPVSLVSRCVYLTKCDAYLCPHRSRCQIPSRTNHNDIRIHPTTRHSLQLLLPALVVLLVRSVSPTLWGPLLGRQSQDLDKCTVAEHFLLYIMTPFIKQSLAE